MSNLIKKDVISSTEHIKKVDKYLNKNSFYTVVNLETGRTIINMLGKEFIKKFKSKNWIDIINSGEPFVHGARYTVISAVPGMEETFMVWQQASTHEGLGEMPELTPPINQNYNNQQAVMPYQTSIQANMLNKSLAENLRSIHEDSVRSLNDQLNQINGLAESYHVEIQGLNEEIKEQNKTFLIEKQELLNKINELEKRLYEQQQQNQIQLLLSEQEKKFEQRIKKLDDNSSGLLKDLMPLATAFMSNYMGGGSPPMATGMLVAGLEQQANYQQQHKQNINYSDVEIV